MLIKIFLILLLFILILIYCLKINNKSLFTLSDKVSSNDIINLKKGQQIMTNMFEKFDNICQKYNIKYWAIAGTLIGVIRHAGWIPWDGDIDIGMLQEDYDKFKNFIHELPPDMIFIEPIDKPCSKIRSTKAIYKKTKYSNPDDWDKGIQIDIFIYNNNNGIISFNKNNWNGIIGFKSKRKEQYNKIFPVKRKKFDNIYVNIPNKYKILSKETWGNYPPPMIPIKDRYCHEGSIELIK